MNINHAHYVKNKLKEKGLEILSRKAFFNEFIVICNEPIEELSEKLLAQSMVAGYNVSDYVGRENAMLICVTEKRTKEEMDALVTVLTGEENK